MVDWDTVDETCTKFGLLKVLRDGNGYVWKVFGIDNFERPLFSGRTGQFRDAQKQAEEKLFKDLKQIFWLLSQASEKERREGEPMDAELIEQAIRQINGGDKARAVHFLDQAIRAEGREKEPEDVRRLQQARTMILAEKTVEKFEPAARQTELGRKLEEAENQVWPGGTVCPKCLREDRKISRTNAAPGGAYCSNCGWSGTYKSVTKFGLYECPFCGEQFDTYAEMEDHRSECPGENKGVGDDTPEIESEVNNETEHLQKFPSEPAQEPIHRPEMKAEPQECAECGGYRRDSQHRGKADRVHVNHDFVTEKAVSKKVKLARALAGMKKEEMWNCPYCSTSVPEQKVPQHKVSPMHAKNRNRAVRNVKSVRVVRALAGKK